MNRSVYHTVNDPHMENIAFLLSQWRDFERMEDTLALKVNNSLVIGFMGTTLRRRP